MTQSDFNSFFKSGDAGAAWAAAENHIAQQIDISTRAEQGKSADALKAANEKSAADLAAAEAKHANEMQVVRDEAKVAVAKVTEDLADAQIKGISVQAELETLKKCLQSASDAHARGDMDAVAAELAEAQKPMLERQAAALDAQIEALQRQRKQLGSTNVEAAQAEVSMIR